MPHTSVCVCVCVRARARARVCVRACFMLSPCRMLVCVCNSLPLAVPQGQLLHRNVCYDYQSTTRAAGGPRGDARRRRSGGGNC